MNILDNNSKEYSVLNTIGKALLSFNIKQSNTYYKMPLYEQLTNMSDIISNITSYDQKSLKTLNFVQLLFNDLNRNNYETIDTLTNEYKVNISDYLKNCYKHIRKL